MELESEWNQGKVSWNWKLKLRVLNFPGIRAQDGRKQVETGGYFSVQELQGEISVQA